LQVTAVIESLPLRHTVWVAEKSRRIALKIARNGRNSASLALKLNRRKCLLNAGGRLYGLFLRRADEQSGLNDSIRRMQCDHKPMMGRKRLDFCPPSENGIGLLIKS
jgi:hypothetical protein